ncbi:MAG: RelA/SpoT domain-containing protein [Planctomycetaceae bacterium]|nr:RelA/SpoT domain-containing protein [Planctomycetaceae bacterium]
MTPKYTRGSINRIGKILIADDLTPQERDEVLGELNDWRSMHLEPMNAFQATLRKYVKTIDPKHGIVAQRLKRTPTIIDKLKNRHRVMKLGEMQDIGGLRAIVGNVAKVRELEKKYDKSKVRHILRRKRDYIAEPQESGYRGIHLVYANVNPKKPDDDGLLIEIQLRSRLQHLWATAVETVGTFFHESLKSSQGSSKWLDFFKLVSAAFAREEGEQPHETYRDLTYRELLTLLKDYVDSQTIFTSLRLILAANYNFNQKSEAAYWFLESYVNNPTILVFSFKKGQEEEATSLYRTYEESFRCRNGETQVVLVSVDSVKKMVKAYPNFFSDISDFNKELNRLYQDASALTQ